MHRRLFSLVIVVALATATILAAGAVAGRKGSGNGTMCSLNTQLRPENDPPVNSTATGHAQIKLRNDGTLEFKVFILNPNRETFVGGHVHVLPSGAPVVLLFGGPTLFGGPPTSETHIWQRGELAVGSQLASAICSAPSSYYVNYHTTQDLAGATRGSL